MRIQNGLLVLGLLLGGAVFAEESEFKGKLQEDLDGYKATIKSNCGMDVKAEWTGGKLGSNPREATKPEWNSVSTLCTSGMEAITQACDGNDAVKAALKGVKTVQCTTGKGTLTYSKSGGTLTLKVDPSFVKNNPAGQQSDLVAKMKKELDT